MEYGTTYSQSSDSKDYFKQLSKCFREVCHNSDAYGLHTTG